MTRKAFLIGGNYTGKNALLGVQADIDAWKCFLCSPIGGNWESDEVVDLSGMSANDIKTVLGLASAIDYTLVCFSGHGYITTDRFGFSVTQVCLDDTHEMSERELNTGSDRCMAIFDCCRKPAEPAEESLIALANSVDFSRSIDTRAKYERALAECEKGFVRVFAADVEQAADDDRSFTRTIIGIAQDQSEGYVNGILRIDEAVRLSDEVMPPQQSPQYHGGRRIGHFPFAVKPITLHG